MTTILEVLGDLLIDDDMRSTLWIVFTVVTALILS